VLRTAFHFMLLRLLLLGQFHLFHLSQLVAHPWGKPITLATGGPRRLVAAACRLVPHWRRLSTIYVGLLFFRCTRVRAWQPPQNLGSKGLSCCSHPVRLRFPRRVPRKPQSPGSPDGPPARRWRASRAEVGAAATHARVALAGRTGVSRVAFLCPIGA